MNIRMRVKLSFVFVVFLLLCLGFISAIITYQIKENSNFRENVAKILLMQEGMNDIINKTTKLNDTAPLEALREAFVEHEKNFEAIRGILSQKKKFYLANTLIPNIRQNETIKTYLNELYENEHRIEMMYDELFGRVGQKFIHTTLFDALYPHENTLRIAIQKHILEHNQVEQIKILSDVRYYSKETLYQHSNHETLQKWLDAVEKLRLQSEGRDGELLKQVVAYQAIVQKIGEKAIEIEAMKKLEAQTLLGASEVLENNKKLSVALEENMAILSGGFIDKMRFIQLFGGAITIVFIIILAMKVSRNVSLTMDEVEEKIDEGLKEVTALNQEIEETQKEIIFTMGSIGESRSKETGNHVKRMAEYCYILALHYGLDEEEAQMLKMASPMHDIGKVGIPDAVLNKPGRFDEAERRIMDTHAMLGYEMLKHSQRPLLKMAAIVAKEHHEKWDGTGYSEKKAGEDIHIYGRITALADVFDALGSERVYKPAWDDAKIFTLFKEERGKHFDPKLVDIFFEHLEMFLHVRDSMKDILQDEKAPKVRGRSAKENPVLT
jgi:HD-GYP domain-containing protein (c-di-GMP phosphodiesterase class II)